MDEDHDLEWMGYRSTPYGWLKPVGYSLLIFRENTIHSFFRSPTNGSTQLWSKAEYDQQKPLKEFLAEFEAWYSRPLGGGKPVDMGFMPTAQREWRE